MIKLNAINYNGKYFQVFIDQDKNRVIMEITKDNNDNETYQYPELFDLIQITKKYFLISNEFYINEEKQEVIDMKEKQPSKVKRIKFRFKQMVLIAGIAVMVAFTVPGIITTDFSYISQPIHSIQATITSSRLTTIDSIEQLNEVFGANGISSTDVHRAIEENSNLEEYREIMHQFVEDVDRVIPQQNWWIFYQNVQRMNIIIFEEHGRAGVFRAGTSEVGYSPTRNKIISLRHEFVHALSEISIIIDSYLVNMSFLNLDSYHGLATKEVLVAVFNTYISDYQDNSYTNIEFFLQPLIDQKGTYEITSYLSRGDINNFSNDSMYYFDDIDALIGYLDVFLNQCGTQSIDTYFLERFHVMSINFFLTLRANQLDNNLITYEEYVEKAIYFKTSLYFRINRAWNCDNVEFMNILEHYAMFAEYEQRNLGERTTLQEVLDNRSDNFRWEFRRNNELEKFDDVTVITSIPNGGMIEDIFNTRHNHYIPGINPEEVLLAIERIPQNGELQLRLILEYNMQTIDVLTSQLISENADIIAKVSIIDYINSIPYEVLVENSDLPNRIRLHNSFFNPNEIMEFAQANNILYNGFQNRFR